MIDGLQTEYARIANISGATLAVTSSEIGNAELAANAASGTKLTLEVPLLYGGSPSIGNWAMQFGTATANSWKAFDTPFAATPTVFCVASASGLGQMVFGATASAGSFLPSGGAAVGAVYLAIGSGRI